MNPPETAPRDGVTMILVSIGWPWLLPAVWNAYDNEWVTATVQACPMENGLTDTYLETEREKDSALKGWLPFPQIPTQPKSSLP